MKLGEFGDPVLLALAVVGDDFGGGVLDEGFAREFFGDLLDLGFNFADFAVEALGLGGGVDDAFEREVDRAEIGRAGGVADRSFFTNRDRFGVEEVRENGEFVFYPISGRGELPRQARGGCGWSRRR